MTEPLAGKVAVVTGKLAPGGRARATDPQQAIAVASFVASRRTSLTRRPKLRGQANSITKPPLIQPGRRASYATTRK